MVQKLFWPQKKLTQNHRFKTIPALQTLLFKLWSVIHSIKIEKDKIIFYTSNGKSENECIAVLRWLNTVRIFSSDLAQIFIYCRFIFTHSQNGIKKCVPFTEFL